ncbi:hypothetical protein [Shewanella frigidimarina]|uniref:hypothetical protein n=1 Tax=Shewanella frigidimarina TaxID=56812 RepID=UPI003D7998E0
MSNIYVIDGVGLTSLALIYHDKKTTHELFLMLTGQASSNNKYITTETSIMTAFCLSANSGKPKLVEALKRVMQHFFDEAARNFEVVRKKPVKILQDFGTFVYENGSDHSMHVLDAAFIAAEMYPGAIVIGKSSQLYSSNGITVYG